MCLWFYLVESEQVRLSSGIRGKVWANLQPCGAHLLTSGSCTGECSQQKYAALESWGHLPSWYLRLTECGSPPLSPVSRHQLGGSAGSLQPPCSPTAPLSQGLCCSLQVLRFGFDPLRILLCKTSLGVHFSFVPWQIPSGVLFFFTVSVFHISFTPRAKSKVSSSLSKHSFLCCLVSWAAQRGSASPCVCCSCVSSGSSLRVISEPCTHHMHQELFLNQRIKLLSSTTWSNQCGWAILPG